MNTCVSLKQLKLNNMYFVSYVYLVAHACRITDHNCFNNVVMLKSVGDKGNMAMLSGLPMYNRLRIKHMRPYAIISF